jgi:hypothetical protein
MYSFKDYMTVNYTGSDDDELLALAAMKRKRADADGTSESVDPEKDDDMSEAKTLKSRVQVVKGPHAGKSGWIREIKHGAFKGAPKTFYVDLDDGGQANNLPASALRLVQEKVSAEK